MEKEEKILPRKVRGVASIDEHYGVVFKPYKEGDTRKEDERKARQSSIYTTQGEKQQRRVCHLSVDSDAADPVGEMLQDFANLTKSDVVASYADARGKKLVEEQGIAVTANKSKGLITTVLTIDVTKTPNYEKELFDLFQKILKCFTINQTYLASLRNVQKKSSHN